MTYVAPVSINDFYVLCAVFLGVLFFGIGLALGIEWMAKPRNWSEKDESTKESDLLDWPDHVGNDVVRGGSDRIRVKD